MAMLIDGKAVSLATRERLAAECERIKVAGVDPRLAVVLVGNDPASAVYVKNKEKACHQVGIEPLQITLPEATPEAELLDLIDRLNKDDTVHGILVQLPLPRHISAEHVIDAIDPQKDVDAFTHESVARIFNGNYSYLPCTPAGIMELLRYYNVQTEGKECVVLGRSDIVGKPMALLMLHANATVTVCHSRTKNLADVTRRADILVVAIGRPEFVTADMIKPGAVVIDVGINRLADGRLVGDVDFAAASEVASMITPVPGGVGPMTITMLMKNTLTAAKAKISPCAKNM
jgi:methylenetetrahydrofolate dehydrogenase (NADP+)/methenyltetrahydrofolate cyclohydrolase